MAIDGGLPAKEPRAIGAVEMTIATYRDDQLGAVRAIWQEAFPADPPWNHAEHVIPRKQAVQPELLIVAKSGEDVVGTALGGYDGHRGWIYSVVVAANHRRRGIGTLLGRELERRLTALGCDKINLQILSMNLALVRFYHKLGFETEDRISMGKRRTDPKPTLGGR